VFSSTWESLRRPAALENPVRRIFLNIAVTTLSVAAAPAARCNRSTSAISARR